MIFKKLTIENYKSFQFATDIIFLSNRKGKSVFLIGGMNGSGKTSIMEAITYCLYGAKVDEIFRCINRLEKAKDNTCVSFELTIEMDDLTELVVKRYWSSGVTDSPKPKDLIETLVINHGGQPVSVRIQQMWQDFIRASIPPSITQHFFFNGDKILEIASDDHSEVRLKSSLEAALGIEYINRLSDDILYIKQEERKGFVDISDEDINFKESELKRAKNKLKLDIEERDDLLNEIEKFKLHYSEVRRKFQEIFNIEPKTRAEIRQIEKKHVRISNRLTQIENEIKSLMENMLPFSIAGKLFTGIRKQIETEREALQSDAVKENAAELARRIVRVVEDPEPIYGESLSPEKMAELEQRIFCLLKKGYSNIDTPRILNLSERDAARVMHLMDSIESSDVFRIQPLLEEKIELGLQIHNLEANLLRGTTEDLEKELFDQLQGEMESCSTQIGRKMEQLRIKGEDILIKQNNINSIELEIEKLYEKHSLAKEKLEFINECDTIRNMLRDYITLLRKSKVYTLQEKTFEMFKLLSSKSSLIKDITIDEHSYEIRISDRNDNEIKKSGLSAGEKEVFAISLLWGLAQTSQIKLPVIIDTPLSRLDSTHRDNIVRNYFPNAGDQVIILSTDTEINQEYYRSLKPHLSGVAILEFDKRQELTTINKGYFWEV